MCIIFFPSLPSSLPPSLPPSLLLLLLWGWRGVISGRVCEGELPADTGDKKKKNERKERKKKLKSGLKKNVYTKMKIEKK